MAYQPIDNYGVIGDMQTVALVGMDGSIDWFCFPRFDSPSVFGALLDDQKGGRFRITSDCRSNTQKQLYWPETNVLVTRFLSTEGVGEIRDFMPIGHDADGRPHHLLVRHVRAVRGSVCFSVTCQPAFNYARDDHQTEISADGASFHSHSLSLTEETLDHLEGYRGSSPVRIGNGAYNQLQLDIYGELMDAVYLYNKYGSPISYELWVHLAKMANWVVQNWRQKDEGIWEVRGGKQHFVYSKLMCWVALDRAIRLADKRSFPADRHLWLAARDELYQEIMTKGWSSKLQAFVQHYDCQTLDAASLIMPLVFFVSPTDTRMLKTLDAISQPPDQGGLAADNLVYRYNVAHTSDGLSGEEGTFNMCTFWLVEAMTRAGRTDHERLDAARLTFEKMLSYANHLGLYAEETGRTGEALGNFPQAFTHLSLISAAYNLDRALNEAR